MRPPPTVLATLYPVVLLTSRGNPIIVPVTGLLSRFRKRQTSNNTEFTTAQIVMQLPGFPKEDGETSLQLAVTIGIPEPPAQLLPQSATVAISLGSVTQFYLQTGRSFARVVAFDNNSNSLMAWLGTSIPLLLMFLLLIFHEHFRGVIAVRVYQANKH